MMTYHQRALQLTGKRTSQVNDILNLLLANRDVIAETGTLGDFQSLIQDILKTDIEMIETLNNMEMNSMTMAEEITEVVAHG